jgi:hypothetical protein
VAPSFPWLLYVRGICLPYPVPLFSKTYGHSPAAMCARNLSFAAVKKRETQAEWAFSSSGMSLKLCDPW